MARRGERLTTVLRKIPKGWEKRPGARGFLEMLLMAMLREVPGSLYLEGYGAQRGFILAMQGGPRFRIRVGRSR